MHLRLAGWMVALDVQPPELADVIERRYAAWRRQPGVLDFEGPDLSVEIAAKVGSDHCGSLFDTPIIPRGVDFLLDAPQFYGIIEPLRGQASLRVRSSDPACEVEYFLRVAMALFAYHHEALLVHGAALKANERTFLFIGQSGSGKSTVVSLSTGAGHALALGDDLILLRHDALGWRAHGTPFWNLSAVDRHAERENGLLSGIYKLIQDRRVFVEPMSPAAAVAELVANAPVVNSQPALLVGLLDRCREIAKVVGVQRLHFRKDDAFWDVIDAAGRP
jgi:hypothetical protein